MPGFCSTLRVWRCPLAYMGDIMHMHDRPFWASTLVWEGAWGGERKAAEGVHPMMALGTMGLHRRYSMKAGRGGVSFTPVAPRGTPSGRAIETGVAGLGERPIAEHCRIEIVACRPPSIDPSPERTCGTRSNLPRDAAFRQWRPWVVSSTSHLPLHGNLDHDFHPTSRHRRIFQS
jgi:hypothetical protein